METRRTIKPETTFDKGNQKTPKTEVLEKPLKAKKTFNKMGACLQNGGCTFTIWAEHAANVFLMYKISTSKVKVEEMQKVSIEGYGDSCFTIFIPGLKENTKYRYIIEYENRAYERIDAWGQSIVYPNWTIESQDDSDAWSVIVDREFEWDVSVDFPNWNEMVIYQLHIGTFFDDKPGIPAKISSIIPMISYFKELGVNVIQLLPFTEFASPLSMGYNSMLPYAIEKDYGTPREFKEFIQTCHRFGIAVFLDVIYNHIDIRYGNAPPKPYSLADYDGWANKEFPDGVFFYDINRISTPWGAPRPDYSRPEVRRYFIDNIKVWIEEYNIDGFRFDSTKCMRKRQIDNSGSCNGPDLLKDDRNYGWELMQSINNLIIETYPQKFSIAEDLDNNEWIIKNTFDGGAGFDSQWDATVRENLKTSILQPFDEMVNLDGLAYAIQNPLGGEPLHRIIYLESHDEAKSKRIPDLIYPGDAEGWFARKKSMLAIGIILTTPGIPMLFQGQECLCWQTWNDSTPIDWNQLHRFPKYFRFYKDLIGLRTNKSNNTEGLTGSYVQIIQCNNQNKILAFRRWSKANGSDSVIVVANFADRVYNSYTLGFPDPGTWYVRLNSDANVYSDNNDFNALYCYNTVALQGWWDNQPYHGNIGIGPYSIVILSK
jgi:1,4-alpha-glucan branching enzyme